MEIKVGSAMRSKVSLANLSEKSGSSAGGGDGRESEAKRQTEMAASEVIVSADLSADTTTTRLKCRCAHSKTAIDVSIER